MESLCNKIVNYSQFINYINTYTTDKNEKKYLYLSLENFTKKILDGSIIEALEKNDEFYGTDIDFLLKDKINIKIFDINSIQCLLQNPEIDLYPIYIYSEPKDLIKRMLDENKYSAEDICKMFLNDLQIYNEDNFNFEYNKAIIPFGKEKSFYIDMLIHKIINIISD